MIDPREQWWSREKVAEFLDVTPEYVDRIKHKLPAPSYVGRLPRWKAGGVIDALESGALSHRCPKPAETRASA